MAKQLKSLIGHTVSSDVTLRTYNELLPDYNRSVLISVCSASMYSALTRTLLKQMLQDVSE